jgi:hypothetical protein
MLSKMVENQWGTLSGFTHTGFKQITRRYTGDVLQPNYPEMEVIQCLNFASTIGWRAAMELAMLSNNETYGAQHWNEPGRAEMQPTNKKAAPRRPEWLRKNGRPSTYSNSSNTL